MVWIKDNAVNKAFATKSEFSGSSEIWRCNLIRIKKINTSHYIWLRNVAYVDLLEAKLPSLI